MGGSYLKDICPQRIDFTWNLLVTKFLFWNLGNWISKEWLFIYPIATSSLNGYLQMHVSYINDTAHFADLYQINHIMSIEF